MPFIGDKFYINPAYGRAVERAREAESVSQHAGSEERGQGDHWVTIDGNHVLIQETQAKRAPTPPHLSARDKAYLDKYYDAVAALAKKYNVDPAIVLGVGIESGFASKGTYLSTGDAFGMTGGSTNHMTRAASPDQNVQQFFDNYGNQIRGTGSDASAFINALQGRNPSGKRVAGWKVYNSVRPVEWRRLINRGIGEMRQAVPIHLSRD
jgi:hypothetical protein